VISLPSKTVSNPTLISLNFFLLQKRYMSLKSITHWGSETNFSVQPSWFCDDTTPEFVPRFPRPRASRHHPSELFEIPSNLLFSSARRISLALSRVRPMSEHLRHPTIRPPSPIQSPRTIPCLDSQCQISISLLAVFHFT
jgi:hypothetical protein